MAPHGIRLSTLARIRRDAAIVSDLSSGTTAEASTKRKGEPSEVNQVAPAEQARMRQIAKPVTERFAASYDPAIVRLYDAELARIRK